jgi:hypothetical protein
VSTGADCRVISTRLLREWDIVVEGEAWREIGLAAADVRDSLKGSCRWWGGGEPRTCIVVCSTSLCSR